MAVRIREYTAADGVKIHFRQWADDPHSDALIYLHGIESHSGWFAECAEEIARCGVSVYAPDRRGSGLNSRLRGHCNSFRRLVDDVIRFANDTARSHERLHLAALSWGGKLALAVDMLHPSTFSSLTLISPGIFPRVMPGFTERLSIALDAFFRPQALHGIPIEDEMFTSQPKYLDFIKNDPLRLRKVTARFYLESVRLDRFLKSRRYQWSVPTQFLLAQYDEIIDNDRVRAIFESLEMKRKRLSVYEGCKHSLQFERPGEVVKEIIHWMEAEARSR